MKIKIAIASLISLVLVVASTLNVSAVSNEIGTYKETMFVDTLRNSGNTENIIDGQIGTWAFITSPYKYGLRINLRRSGTSEPYPFKDGDIITFSYVLAQDSGTLNLNTNAPTPATCLTSSWRFTIIDCRVQVQYNMDFETWVDYAELNARGVTGNNQGGSVTQWSQIWNNVQANGYKSQSLDVYYFQYTLRVTGDDTRDNIILYSTFTNGQPWALRFNETITVNTSMEQGAIQAQQNEQNAGETAQQDGQQAGNNAETTAEQGSASLLQGATSIIGALTDTQAGNCTINLNMGTLDMGTQDFCQGDIGPIRPIIATITNVLFAFVAFKVFAFLIGVMFGLFDEFFGTRTEKG